MPVERSGLSGSAKPTFGQPPRPPGWLADTLDAPAA